MRVIDRSGDFSELDFPIHVQLRHWTEPLWCGAGGRWVEERRTAIRFGTNLDAVAYCVALSLRAWVVAFDASGHELYQLDVERIANNLMRD